MRKRYNKKGVSLLELVFAVLALMPIMFYALDIALILWTTVIANTLVQASCRLAANGAPAELTGVHTKIAVPEYSAPYKRARAALSEEMNGIVKIKPHVNVLESVYAPVPVSPIGGPVFGEISVEIDFILELPVPMPGLPERVCVPARQTMPITWTLPASLPPEKLALGESD